MISNITEIQSDGANVRFLMPTYSMPPSVSKAQAKCRCEKCHNRMKCKQITPQAAVGGRRLGHKDEF